MLCDKLKINGGKTEFVVISTRQQLYKVHVDSLAVGDAQVSPVQSVKNLGGPGHFGQSYTKYYPRDMDS